MSALEKAELLICEGKSVPTRTLFVAYLELHMAHPTIHPDDHLRNDENACYHGWEVILCHSVFFKDITEDFRYPTAFLKLPAVLEELDSFHEDIWKDSDDDMDYQMWGNVGDVKDWLEDMDTKNIHLATEALLKLHLYHASENDTIEEEEEKPAGVLRTCHDVLLWISQQAN